jgi:hypothetical protein
LVWAVSGILGHFSFLGFMHSIRVIILPSACSKYWGILSEFLFAFYKSPFKGPSQCLQTSSKQVPSMKDPKSTKSNSKQAFPRQFNFPRRLAGLETTFAHARHAALAELNLVLGRGESAGAVVREVYAAEGVRAEIFVAVC